MKNYEELAYSALKRINEYETKQRKRKKIIKEISVVLGCICVAVIVTTGIFKLEIFDKNVEIDEVYQGTGKEITQKTAKNPLYYESISDRANTTEKHSATTKSERTTKKTIIEKTTQNSTPPMLSEEKPLEEWLNDESVVWNDMVLKGSIDFAKPISKGSVAITEELSNAIENADDNNVFALMVSYESALPDNYLENIMCDEKTAAEILAEAEQLLASGENEEAKILYGQVNEAKKEYFLGYIESFKETFKKNGMSIYTESNGTTIDNTIFYTFATAEQLQNFTCEETEAFYFTLATRFK